MQVEADSLEGLPVRQWTKGPIRLNNNPLRDTGNAAQDDCEWPELPMPKDSHLYEPHTQHLLRIAREGRTGKQTSLSVENNKLLGDEEDADGEIDSDFIFSTWQPLPQYLDQSIPEYLAPRRKGLPSLYGAISAPGDNDVPMRKTKIRKTDPGGIETILEVLVPEGQAVDGEVIEDEAQPTKALEPGTVVDGIGTVNAEGVLVAGEQIQPTTLRKRPPPPKRKAKGPGRGRKKKIMFGRNAHLGENGVRARSDVANGGAATTPGGTVDTSAQDYDMGGDSMLHDGEEGSEEDDEGDEGDDDREDGELSPTPASPPKSPNPSKLDGQTSEATGDRAPENRWPITIEDGHASSPLSSPDVPLCEQNHKKTEHKNVESEQQERLQELQEQVQEEEPPSVQQPASVPELERIVTPQHEQEPSPPPPPQQQQAPDSRTDSMEIETRDIEQQDDTGQEASVVADGSSKQNTIGFQPPAIQESLAMEIAPMQAELPQDISLLEGLTESQVPADASLVQQAQFPDGEEDLLGSLEKTLQQSS